MPFKHISVNEVVTMLEDEQLVIADIRDPNSFQASHIKGAEHLNNSNIGEFMLQKDYEQPIVVVCYHGISSQGAANYLVEQGFDEVYSLDGGFSAWQSQYPDLVSS